MASEPEGRVDDERKAFLPGSRSFKIGRGAVVAILLVAYILVVVTYTRSTQTAGVDELATPPPDGVSLHFVTTSIDATAATLTGLMYVIPGEDLLDERGRLRVDLSVDSVPVLGNGSVTFKVGQVVAPMNLAVRANGAVRDYPFDRYTATIVSAVEIRDGPADQWRTVPTVVGAEGELGGWKLRFTDPDSVEVVGTTFTKAEGYGLQVFELRRAISTIALALLILFLMVLLAVMTVNVTRAVAWRERRVEPSLAGWMGAMLFALVPLRNFLPGAPPLGSWIDVLVFFWVEIVIMLALAAYVATWLRDGADSDHEP